MDNPIRKLFDPSALPVRSEHGTTTHPDLSRFYPGVGGGDGTVDSRFLRDAGWEPCIVEFSYDAYLELRKAYDAGQPFADWEPSPPPGQGWLLAAIWDAEDGPIAYFVRELVPSP